MHVFVVTSPGTGLAAHWSDAVAAELTQELARHGVPVDWLRVVKVGAAEAAAPMGVTVHSFRATPSPLWRVRAANDDVPLEVALSQLLRPVSSGAVVVHVGVGACGSPNVLWIADRLGMRSFAFARAAELVCARGDLVHADGTPCREFEDAARCRRCCSSSWRRRPHASEFLSRVDLLVGGLMVAERVFVPSPDDVQPLLRVGVPRTALSVSATIEPLLELLSGLRGENPALRSRSR